ncbi:hypothetical protein [Leifsonia xyli]|uniref:hypothetical protein n=1 Tax=Leifsonia xyli TaxID=1575 RepID=UPI001CB7FC77|nr:hypothetical protein [Leifsonia xyli]
MSQLPAPAAPALLSASPSTVAAARAVYSSWRSSWLSAVVGPIGNLALIETRWLPEGDTTSA